MVAVQHFCDTMLHQMQQQQLPVVRLWVGSMKQRPG